MLAFRLGWNTFQSSEPAGTDNQGGNEMTTKEKAEKAKFHIEFMLLMLGVGRTEEAQQSLEKALAYLDQLIEEV